MDPDLAEIEQNSSIWNPNITKTVSLYVTRPFRCIHLNCFNRLGLLAEVGTKLQKIHFFRQFKNQEGDIETIQMTPIFSCTFSALTVCNIHLGIWKYSQFIFMWFPLWSILVCKIPQVLGKSHSFGLLNVLF